MSTIPGWLIVYLIEPAAVLTPVWIVLFLMAKKNLQQRRGRKKEKVPAEQNNPVGEEKKENYFVIKRVFITPWNEPKKPPDEGKPPEEGKTPEEEKPPEKENPSEKLKLPEKKKTSENLSRPIIRHPVGPSIRPKTRQKPSKKGNKAIPVKGKRSTESKSKAKQVERRRDKEFLWRVEGRVSRSIQGALNEVKGGITTDRDLRKGFRLAIRQIAKEGNTNRLTAMGRIIFKEDTGSEIGEEEEMWFVIF